MSKAEDINTLFRRFGGDAGTYQEISANELAGAAMQRWPILGELRPQAHREAPDARKGGAAVGDRQIRGFLTPPVVSAAPVVPDRRISPVVGDEEVLTPPLRTPVTDLAEKPVEKAVVAPVLSVVAAPVEASALQAAPASVTRVQQDVTAKPVAGSVGTLADALQSLQLPVTRASGNPATFACLGNQPPAPSASMPATAAPAAQAETGSDLQSLFNRLVPRKPDVPAAPPSAPLKRLVKW